MSFAYGLIQDRFFSGEIQSSKTLDGGGVFFIEQPYRHCNSIVGSKNNCSLGLEVDFRFN